MLVTIKSKRTAATLARRFTQYLELISIEKSKEENKEKISDTHHY